MSTLSLQLQYLLVHKENVFTSEINILFQNNNILHRFGWCDFCFPSEQNTAPYSSSSACAVLCLRALSPLPSVEPRQTLIHHSEPSSSVTSIVSLLKLLFHSRIISPFLWAPAHCWHMLLVWPLGCHVASALDWPLHHFWLIFIIFSPLVPNPGAGPQGC